MASLSFRGAFTALVTPFDASGEQIDWSAFEKLVKAQLDGGIRGLVPCGTTGETPTLSDDEQVEVIKRTVEFAAGKVPVLAGTGSNCTKKTIESSQAAVKAGADAVMIVMPYYNKPSQAGMMHHVKTVAAAVDVPVVLYNIPGRSVVELSIDSILTLLDDCPNVVAVKDATGNVLNCQSLIARAGDRVDVLSGDDALTLGMMVLGAKGVISVSSNVIPKRVADVANAASDGNWLEARQAHLKLLSFHAAMFQEPNPAPAKAGLELLGMMRCSVRGPLLPAGGKVRAHVETLLRELGELK